MFRNTDIKKEESLILLTP